MHTEVIFMFYLLYSMPPFQVKKRPSTDFMEKIQKDINANMRAILVDWLVEVYVVIIYHDWYKVFLSEKMAHIIILKCRCLKNTDLYLIHYI